MSKSKKIHHKRHTKRHYKRHTKRHYKKRHMHIKLIPGSKSVPIFSPPEKKNNTPILDSHNDQHDDVGIIPGLRNYLKLRT